MSIGRPTRNGMRKRPRKIPARPRARVSALTRIETAPPQMRQGSSPGAGALSIGPRSTRSEVRAGSEQEVQNREGVKNTVPHLWQKRFKVL
jgi:hypothetical protein